MSSYAMRSGTCIKCIKAAYRIVPTERCMDTPLNDHADLPCSLKAGCLLSKSGQATQSPNVYGLRTDSMISPLFLKTARRDFATD